MSNARNISKLATLAAHVTNLIGLSNNKPAIDAAASGGGASPFPTGSILIHAASAAPSGWLAADGSEVSRTGATAALYAVLGTTHGAGNGTTTFNLPDLRGRTVAGMGGATAGRLTVAGAGINGDTLGAAGGAETHTLSQAQMPSHTHTGATSTAPDHTHGTTAPAASSNQPGYTASNTATTANSKASAPAGSHSHTLTIDATGSGNAHNNTQPTIVLNYIIKT